jgi:hypothetical protein
MIPVLRDRFNKAFSEEKYLQLIREIDSIRPGSLEFRIAETPVFIDKKIEQEMLDCCEYIIDTITLPNFQSMTDRSIPKKGFVAGTEGSPQILVFDFGICDNGSGGLSPQLIEMQGFPSLFAYQTIIADCMTSYADIPENYSSYLNGFDRESSIALMKDIIVGPYDPSEVILLEILPEQQKTRIDFYYTEKLLGIPTVCFTKIHAKGNELFYTKNGVEKKIKRIFNRMILDDLLQQEGLSKTIDLTIPYDVEWIPHPHWFYRISKFTLPFLDHPCIPTTYFLNEVKQPLPLNQYVLKPLFSFAGMGVIIDVTEKDIQDIADPENWILQRKVNYAPIIKTPDGPAMTEIRLFYFRKDEWERPIAVHNLTRLSKGKMVGTRYNLDNKWVGGTIAFFEK